MGMSVDAIVNVPFHGGRNILKPGSHWWNFAPAASWWGLFMMKADCRVRIPWRVIPLVISPARSLAVLSRVVRLWRQHGEGVCGSFAVNMFQAKVARRRRDFQDSDQGDTLKIVESNSSTALIPPRRYRLASLGEGIRRLQWR